MTRENVYQRVARLIDEAVAAGEASSPTSFLKQVKISSSFLPALKERTRLDPNAKVKIGHAARLAKRLGVTVDYINDGRIAMPTIEDKYESRGLTMMAMRILGYPESAVRSVLTIDPGHDPGMEYWRALIEAETARIRSGGPR
jgi:hypothetical protein